MKKFTRIILPMLLVALAASGCVIATGQPESKATAHSAATTTGGAPYCEKSSDGKMVACGGQATYCQQSPDGQAVACGGLATYCEKSADGKAVACGGRATYCERSADGKQIACGGSGR
jgi:hypothetical protein